MPKQDSSTLFFYQNGKLVTLRVGEQGHQIFRHAEMPLAEISAHEGTAGGILATDDKGSVLNVQAPDN